MSDDFASLTADLKNAGDKAQKMAGDAVAKTAADITNDAKVFAPVRTGNLKGSIGYDLMQDSGGVGAEIGPTASYGIHQEHGTSVMAPQPFLGPAFDRRAPDFEKAMEWLTGEVI